jgi:hypothetical protein
MMPILPQEIGHALLLTTSLAVQEKGDGKWHLSLSEFAEESDLIGYHFFSTHALGRFCVHGEKGKIQPDIRATA